MMNQEIGTILSEDSGDLISDFFRLVETPVVEAEVVTEGINGSGYFAETISWLKEVDTPSSISGMELIYQLQDMAITQQLLCSCVSHSSLNDNSSQSSLYNFTNDALYSLSEMSQFSVDSHEGHEHCNCGGHYKDGKCESCGSLKHDD